MKTTKLRKGADCWNRKLKTTSSAIISDFQRFSLSAFQKRGGQAFHGTGRTSLPLLPSGPGGVRAAAHAWRLADAKLSDALPSDQ